MRHDHFPPEVADQLKWYVYRLVDPRNGETFYVGKGRNDRIFNHVQTALSPNDKEDAIDLKYQRIREIHTAGLTISHVIHRHGIVNGDVAYQIEGAVMDAYPGLANIVGGHGSGDYGVREVHEIIAEYSAEPFAANEPLILINISKSYVEGTNSVYEAVRGCWKLKEARAKKHKLVLAHRRGLVVGAFRPTEWLPATEENFPGVKNLEGRWGFVGEPAEPESANMYLDKRVPDKYRTKGAANPVRYVERERSF